MAHVQYSFPVLNVQEVLQCLGELGIPLSEEELTKPQPGNMIHVYSSFFESLMGVTQEDLQQTDFTAMGDLGHPELHEDSIPESNFLRHMRKLMGAVGYPDFSIRDIMKPEPVRTRKIMSALINFGKFREENVARFQSYTDESETLAEKRAALQDENERLTHELKMLEAQREAEEPAVKELKTETDELMSTIMQYSEQQNSLRNEISNMKKTSQEISDKTANDKFTLLNTKEECTKLRGQIVQSPDRVKKMIKELGHTLESEKSHSLELDQKHRDLTARVECLGKVDVEVQKVLKLMEEVEDEVTKHTELVQERERVQTQSADVEKNNSEVVVGHQHLKKQIAAQQEKQSRFDAQSAEKLEEHQEAMDNAKRELDMLMKNRSENQMKIDENEEKMRRISEKISALDTEHRSEMELVSSRFEVLEKQVQQYHTQLAGALHANPVAIE